MGDAYWVLVKLPAFLRKMGYGKPELTIASHPSHGGSHLRSIPYLELFDFFTIGNPPSVANDTTLDAVWHEAYVGPGRSIIPCVQGYDWLVSYNGLLWQGNYIEDDDLACDWYPKMLHVDQMDTWADTYRNKFGPYVALSWPFYGSYAFYWQEFSLDSIAEALRIFLLETGLRPVFIGAHWEPEINPMMSELQAKLGLDYVDYAGQTSMVQLFSLLKGSELFAGYQSGLSIASAFLHNKTLALWCRGQFHDNMRWACVPPDTRNVNYIALDTVGLTTPLLIDELKNLHSKTKS